MELLVIYWLLLVVMQAQDSLCALMKWMRVIKGHKMEAL